MEVEFKMNQYHANDLYKDYRAGMHTENPERIAEMTEECVDKVIAKRDGTEKATAEEGNPVSTTQGEQTPAEGEEGGTPATKLGQQRNDFGLVGKVVAGTGALLTTSWGSTLGGSLQANGA